MWVYSELNLLEPLPSSLVLLAFLSILSLLSQVWNYCLRIKKLHVLIYLLLPWGPQVSRPGNKHSYLMSHLTRPYLNIFVAIIRGGGIQL